uniref:Uncharacterized protein n=1 Tax=Arundo donax TaxID=35708 RepID=A0A0A8YFK1_ARUDO
MFVIKLSPIRSILIIYMMNLH